MEGRASIAGHRAAWRAAALGGLVLVAAGCATVRLHVAVPAEFTGQAQLPGFPGVRYGLENGWAPLSAAVASAVKESPPQGREVAMLAVSGGGSRGGFAAGVLCGWTERGDRPAFQVVCGVSSGAVIAPFAFLGSAYDAQLRTVSTELTNRDIYRIRNPLVALDNDSLVSTEPLAQALSGVLDTAALERIAEAHRQGRRLYVLTTDLDAQRAVVWDMGAIAASGQPAARDLFLRVILASAAVPVAFPPQYFGVEAAGRSFDEMHVDGGLLEQAFLPLPEREAMGAERRLRAYVILNGKLGGDWAEVAPRVVAIATRTFHTLGRARSLANLREIALRAQRVGAEFRYASIPGDFLLQSHTGFQRAYRQELFELGRATMNGGAGFSDVLPMPSGGG